MTSVISLLIVVALSVLVSRVATVALTLTGLSRDVAQFQARSAFTGAGFTTSESEYVVNHPLRRRIVLWLMFLGNLGIVTAVSSLLLAFVDTANPQERTVRLAWLLLGLGVLWALSISKMVDRRLTMAIQWGLRRWTGLTIRDYASLLQLSGEYEVIELTVDEGDWLANKTLAELDLVDEGIIVLGVLRADKTYIGAPRGYTRIVPGDVVILYGREELLEELSHRLLGRSGDQAHRRAIQEQKKELARERIADRLSQFNVGDEAQKGNQ